MKARYFTLLGAMALAGFGSACGTTTSSSSGGAAPSNCQGSVTVATELPTSGADASDGLPTRQGAELAVSQANDNKLLGGCTVKLVNKDDVSLQTNKHDANQGAQNMTALAQDQSILGVVGAFNSAVCKAEAPIANQAGLVMISPSCTNPGLTISGADPSVDTSSLRPTGKITFFRVCTTDVGQGAGLAQAAKDKLNASKAYVFDDQETYGQGLAKQFSSNFTKNGGTVVGTASLPGTTTDFRTELQDAKAKGADLIFFGGTSSNGGGILRQQMQDPSVGLSSAKYLGGDGIVDAEFFTQAGANADGSYGTIVAPDPTKLDSAKQFVSDYQSKYNAAPGAYSANAYDAMNIILQAIKKAIDDNGGKLPTDPKAFRESVRANVAGTNYSGAIGTTSFDQNGDTSNKLLTLDVAQGGKWVYSETVQVKS